MIRTHLSALFVLVVLFSPGSAGLADDASAEARLKGKELRRTGRTYVLPGEAEFARKLGLARNLYQGLTTAVMQQEALEENVQANKMMVQEMVRQRILLGQQLSQATTTDQHNRIVNMLNLTSDRIRLLSNAENDTNTSQGFHAQAANRRDAYIQALLELRALADSTSKTYNELADDAEVKDALAALNQTAKAKVTLGPSRTFLSHVKLLEKAEGGILTDTISLRPDRGIFWVDVTLNGKVTLPMVFDTGASVLSLGAADAAKAGLVPNPSDETITMQTADGSKHEGKKMTLASVRVGKFTARNVECVILPETKSDAPSLLGGPFLKHFTFKMNQAAGTVTFSEVDTPEVSSPKAARRPKAPAPSCRGKARRSPAASSAPARNQTP